MKRQAYQHPELRDANDNIIQEGTYGKESPLVNSDNTGVLDYINNNLEALHDAQTAAGNAITTGGLTVTGETSVPTANEGNSSNAIASTEFVAKSISAEVTRADGKYLPLSGGTMTGSIQYVDNGKVFAIGNAALGNVDLGWNWVNREGAVLGLRSADHLKHGEFSLIARDSANSCSLDGKPDGTLTWNSQPLLPVGIVQAFAGTTIPSGWLLCDGSAVSRTTYANLYACIGDTYGAGDGSTTFNLPNLVDKFVEGSATAGTVKSAGLPNITGSINLVNYPDSVVTNGDGALGHSAQSSSEYTGFNAFQRPYTKITFDASRSSAIYGKSTTVQPPALTMRYIIKY